MISINSAMNLYWLGRYAQRAETIAKESIKSFDLIIDRDFDDGKKLFDKLDIEIEYGDEKDFLRQAVFGEHTASLYSSLLAMKDNATLSRNLISSDAFAYVNRVYIDINSLRTDVVEIYDLEHLLAGLYGFDGMLNSTLIKSKASKLIDFGKRVERVDLEVRLFDDLTVVLFELEGLYTVGHSLSSGFKKINLTTDKKERILDFVNSLASSIIKS